MVRRYHFWQVLTLACGFAIGFMGPPAAEAMPPGDGVVKARIFKQQSVRAVVWQRQPGGAGLLADRWVRVPAPARMIFSYAGPANGARVPGGDGMAGSWRAGSLIKVAGQTPRDRGKAAAAPAVKQGAATPPVKGDARISGVSAARQQSASSDQNDKKGAPASTSQQKTFSSGRDAQKTAQPATDQKKVTKSTGPVGKNQPATVDTKTTARAARDSRQTAPTSAEVKKVTKAAGTDGKGWPATEDTKTTVRAAKDSKQTAPTSVEAKKVTKSAGTDGKGRPAAADTKTTARAAKDSRQVAPASEETKKVAKSAGTDGKGRQTAVDAKTAAASAEAKEVTKSTRTAGKSRQAADTKTAARAAKDSKPAIPASEEAKEMAKSGGTEGKRQQVAADREQTAQLSNDSETAAQASGSSRHEETNRVSIQPVSPQQRDIRQIGDPLPVIEAVSPPPRTADHQVAVVRAPENRVTETGSSNFQPSLTGERGGRSSFESRNNPQSSAVTDSVKASAPTTTTTMYVPSEMPGRISQPQSIPQPVEPPSSVPVSRGFGGSIPVSAESYKAPAPSMMTTSVPRETPGRIFQPQSVPQPVEPQSPAPIARGFGGSIQVSGPMVFQYTDSGRIVGCSVRNIRLDYGWCATFISAKGTDNCRVTLRGDSRILSVGCT